MPTRRRHCATRVTTRDRAAGTAHHQPGPVSARIATSRPQPPMQRSYRQGFARGEARARCAPSARRPSPSWGISIASLGCARSRGMKRAPCRASTIAARTPASRLCRWISRRDSAEIAEGRAIAKRRSRRNLGDVYVSAMDLRVRVDRVDQRAVRRVPEPDHPVRRAAARRE